MPPVPPGAFARSLRGLSDAALAAFVADLWAARGYEARVEGRTVVATTGDGTERLRVAPRGRLARVLPAAVPWAGDRPLDASSSDAAPPDAVVVRSLEAPESVAVDVVDAAALRNVALYAVDRDTRNRLFERHLDVPPVVEPRTGGRVTAPLPVLAAVALVLLAAAVGAISAGLPAGAGPGAPTPETPEPVPPRTPAATPTPAGAGAPAGAIETFDAGQYPPGVGPEGIWSVDRLLAAHVLGLAPRSYRWEITYREVVDGRTQGLLRETVSVANATHYRSSVERRGTVEFSPAVVSSVESYADGRYRYDRSREDGAVAYRRQDLRSPIRDTAAFRDDPIRVIRWYLSVRETAIDGTMERNGTRYYRIVGAGESWELTSDAQVRATISERGTVRRLRRSHRPPDADTLVVVTFRVTEVGDVPVEPPWWLTEARRSSVNASVPGPSR